MTEPTGDASKPALRTWARALAPATPAESDQVVDRLAALPSLVAAERACLYLAMAGEVDLAGLPARLPDVTWLTTRTGASALLTVHALDSPRERHRFGFEQPIAASPRVDPGAVDAWLVPGLAFDPSGNRLGNGAGYYDRLLARAAAGAAVIGVTLERRLAPRVPHEPHDRVVRPVVTERRTIVPGTRRPGSNPAN